MNATLEIVRKPVDGTQEKVQQPNEHLGVDLTVFASPGAQDVVQFSEAEYSSEVHFLKHLPPGEQLIIRLKSDIHGVTPTKEIRLSFSAGECAATMARLLHSLVIKSNQGMNAGDPIHGRDGPGSWVVYVYPASVR